MGITNLAGMCNEYSENEILLEYANALFEYQNVYIEIQKMRHEDVPNGKSRSNISLMAYYKKATENFPFKSLYIVETF